MEIIKTIRLLLILITLIITFANCKRNIAPSCIITEPADSTAVKQGTNLLIKANAIDKNENLYEVAFYVNDSLIETLISSPFLCNWNTNEAVLGYHTINVIATDDEGEQDNDEVVVAVTNANPPIANFSASDSSIFVGSNVSFTDLSSNFPTNWLWNFGDGSPTSTLQNPIHTYTIKGVYTVSLSASNNNGSDTITKTEYITVSTLSNPCPGTPTVTDEDGIKYNTVLIGNQCWMAENLATGTMLNSVSGGSIQSDNGIIEKYCYNNNENNCIKYGGLYEWEEVVQYDNSFDGYDDSIGSNQGICPIGWHVPTRIEWEVLVDYLGGPDIAGGVLKETGFTNWLQPNTGATNLSGFTALPGGYKSSIGGLFEDKSYSSCFWTAARCSFNRKKGVQLYNNYSIADIFIVNSQPFGFSVRCVKD